MTSCPQRGNRYGTAADRFEAQRLIQQQKQRREADERLTARPILKRE